MDRQTKIVKQELYPAVIESSNEGWPGCAYKRQFVEVKVRRIPEGKGGQHEHVQLEIGIDELKGETKRQYSMHAGVSLTPAQVEELIHALKTSVTY